MSIITVDNLSFTCEEKAVLQDVSLKIDAGTIMVLLGPSGSGKTTLCRCLTGIIPHCMDGTLSGRIVVCGHDVVRTPLRELTKYIALVMQDPEMQLVTTAVEDELAFGPENLQLEPTEIRRRVDETAARLGLSELLARNPARLSGGEKQRVAIGSVLTMDPAAIVMDEPMSSLDDAGRQALKDILLSLKQAGKTVIIVEHDFAELNFADRWVVLEHGRIRMTGTPSELTERILEEAQ